MISVCPDSDPPQHCGYDWAVPEISGVSITRVSGVGCSGGGGDVRIRPCPESEPVSIVKGTEKAVPGYYETLFSNGTRGSFIATVNTALERYDFRPTSSKVFHIDFSSSVIKRLSGIKPSGYTVKDDRTIEGWTVSPTVCARCSYKLYFTLVSDTPFKVVGTEEDRIIFYASLYRLYLSPMVAQSPDGYAPEMDEDDGAMSSWYIFASSGLYPLLVGSDEYEVFSPHFDKIVIRSGKAPFTIQTKNRKHLADKAKAVTLNGKPLEGTAIKHSEIAKGGELLFTY